MGQTKIPTEWPSSHPHQTQVSLESKSHDMIDLGSLCTVFWLFVCFLARSHSNLQQCTIQTVAAIFDFGSKLQKPV